MSAQKEDKGERKKALYSEDFRAMLERIEEEDNADTSRQLTKKSRLCLVKVNALEKHFEEDNRLQPERKVKIAEEVGLEPRQVAIWFQNRRARWRAKQLEKEYGTLRASYDALKHDYGSLEQEKVALHDQLKDLKAKIEARNSEMIATTTTLSIPNMAKSSSITNESNCVIPLSAPSAPSLCRRSDPYAMASSTATTMSLDHLEGLQLCKAYQDHLMKELGVHSINNEVSDNFFSVDQAPTLHYWYNGDQFN